VNIEVCGPCTWPPATETTVAPNSTPAAVHGDSSQARPRRGAQANATAATAATPAPATPPAQ
jgi:hypothetical protein